MQKWSLEKILVKNWRCAHAVLSWKLNFVVIGLGYHHKEEDEKTKLHINFIWKRISLSVTIYADANTIISLSNSLWQYIILLNTNSCSLIPLLWYVRVRQRILFPAKASRTYHRKRLSIDDDVCRSFCLGFHRHRRVRIPSDMLHASIFTRFGRKYLVYTRKI